MRQGDNDNSQWKQRMRGLADALTLMSGYAKTCWAVNAPDTLDWLITEPASTQVRANKRSLRADCISPLCEEITQTSGRRAAGSHARRGEDKFTCRHTVRAHVSVCRHFPATQGTMNHLNVSVRWLMIEWRPLYVSLSLTHSREELLNHWDQTPCMVKCLCLRLQQRETVFCSTEPLRERKSIKSISNQVLRRM